MNIIMTANSSFMLVNFREKLIRRIIEDGHRLIIIAPADEYTKYFDGLGCEYREIKMNRQGRSILQESKLFIKLLAEIRSIQPDIVLSYTIKNNLYSGIICRIAGPHFVPNVSGLGPAFSDDGAFSKLMSWLLSISFKKAEAVFFQNRDDMEHLVVDKKISTTKKSILLPGSGIDLKKFEYTPDAHSGNVKFLLLARLIKEKGIYEYVAAARLLREKYKNVQFNLLGAIDSGSKSSIDYNDLQKWHKDGIVNYMGSTHDVRPFLKDSNCVVLPSYYKEGTPRSLLEAASIGRAIITTDTPGCRDVVRDGTNGFLVTPRDVESLYKAMSNYVELSIEEKEQMSAASRALAESEYDDNIVVDCYMNVINNVKSNRLI